jgi:hypothetical protein
MRVMVWCVVSRVSFWDVEQVDLYFTYPSSLFYAFILGMLTNKFSEHCCYRIVVSWCNLMLVAFDY